MNEKKIILNSCCLDDLELLEGFTIDNVMTAIDASAEGWQIKCTRQVDNVILGRDFCFEDGEYYISNEYVVNVI